MNSFYKKISKLKSPLIPLTAISIGDVFKSPIATTKPLGNLVTFFMESAIAVAGVIIIIFFLVGGITIISSAGSGRSEGLEKGKKTLTWGLVGFIIIAFAYLIVQLIEAIVGQKFITSPALPF